jgi:hypothetical protein
MDKVQKHNSFNSGLDFVIKEYIHYIVAYAERFFV